MPLKTKYEIYGRVKAPVLSTYDKTMARIEWGEYMRNVHKHGIHRLVQTVEPDGELTKQEEYLYLVYRVRKLWKQYFECGRKKEDLEESLKLEAELDAWNFKILCYMRSHPSRALHMDDEAYSFYVKVSEWRNTWKERQRYRGGLSCDEAAIKELSRKCRDLEKQIDLYIKKKLNFI